MTERDGAGTAEGAPPAEQAVDRLHQVERESGGIAIQCQFCVGRNFRRSRLRRTDVKQLLLLRYPVRCLRCSQRQMVSFSVAGISVPSHVKHVPERSAVAMRGGQGAGPADRPGR